MSFRGVGRVGVLCVLIGVSACSRESQGAGGAAPEAAQETGTSEAWDGNVEAATRSVRPREGTEDDWRIFRSLATQAWEAGMDTLPMGESVAQVGLLFVGTDYAPGTLEVAGEESVVVNLQALDCVTFVENALAIARFIRSANPSILESDLQTRSLFMRLLAETRYRGGKVDGYPSRLHYFSDWIWDNEARGLVKEITQDLRSELDAEGIDFMSSHPEAYRQLADPANLAGIERVEVELSRVPRYKLPKERITGAAPSIRNGDIIAATSTVEGLDIAHTGLAYWMGDTLHLLHAPLVGEAVEVSRLPLAERILRLDTQDGIRVVRPLDPRPGATGGGVTGEGSSGEGGAG